MGAIIKFRRDILANWETENPVISNGEIILVLDANGDTTAIKVGNGVSTFSELQSYSSFDVTSNHHYTAAQSGEITTDNDGSFDTSITNDFKCTAAADLTFSFTNLISGRRGQIILDNTSGSTISLSANVKADADCSTTITSAGIYLIGYLTDGVNVYLSYSKALV